LEHHIRRGRDFQQEVTKLLVTDGRNRRNRGSVTGMTSVEGCADFIQHLNLGRCKLLILCLEGYISKEFARRIGNN